MKLKTPIGFCLTALLLTSCAKIGADSFCAVARPIYIDRCHDVLSDKTAAQLNDYDDTGARECGWKKHAGPVCKSATIP